MNANTPTPMLDRVQSPADCRGMTLEELKQLAELSHPKVTLDTSGLSPAATALANELAAAIRELPEDAAEDLRRRLAAWRGK